MPEAIMEDAAVAIFRAMLEGVRVFERKRGKREIGFDIKETLRLEALNYREQTSQRELICSLLSAILRVNPIIPNWVLAAIKGSRSRLAEIGELLDEGAIADRRYNIGLLYAMETAVYSRKVDEVLDFIQNRGPIAFLRRAVKDQIGWNKISSSADNTIIEMIQGIVPSSSCKKELLKMLEEAIQLTIENYKSKYLKNHEKEWFSVISWYVRKPESIALDDILLDGLSESARPTTLVATRRLFYRVWRRCILKAQETRER